MSGSSVIREKEIDRDVKSVCYGKYLYGGTSQGNGGEVHIFHRLVGNQ